MMLYTRDDIIKMPRKELNAEVWNLMKEQEEVAREINMLQEVICLMAAQFLRDHPCFTPLNNQDPLEAVIDSFIRQAKGAAKA